MLMMLVFQLRPRLIPLHSSLSRPRRWGSSNWLARPSPGWLRWKTFCFKFIKGFAIPAFVTPKRFALIPFRFQQERTRPTWSSKWSATKSNWPSKFWWRTQRKQRARNTRPCFFWGNSFFSNNKICFWPNVKPSMNQKCFPEKSPSRCRPFSSNTWTNFSKWFSTRSTIRV